MSLSANVRAHIARQVRRGTRGEAAWSAAEVIALARFLDTTVDELAKETP